MTPYIDVATISTSSSKKAIGMDSSMENFVALTINMGGVVSILSFFSNSKVKTLGLFRASIR